MKRILGAVVLACLSASPLSAHHSYASFDREHPVTIEGTIGRVVFANPHVVLAVQTADKLYNVEWGNLGQMNHWAVTKDTLNVGDHVRVTGSKTFDPADNRFSIVLKVERVSDGRSWGRQATPVVP